MTEAAGHCSPRKKKIRIKHPPRPFLIAACTTRCWLQLNFVQRCKIVKCKTVGAHPEYIKDTHPHHACIFFVPLPENVFPTHVGALECHRRKPQQSGSRWAGRMESSRSRSGRGSSTLCLDGRAWSYQVNNGKQVHLVGSLPLVVAVVAIVRRLAAGNVGGNLEQNLAQVVVALGSTSG
jgi:hypothetical protein